MSDQLLEARAQDDLALVASGLTKKYGDNTVVNGLDLRVERGQIYGLLGPNGSGKSTTLRMLTGILAPSAGSAIICGHDLWKEPEKAKAVMGYVPDEPVLYEKLSAKEFLDFVGELHGVPGSDRRARIDRLVHVLDLEEKASDLIESYSRGMKQKVSIAASLIHHPHLLILDEPITGLDPVSTRILKTVLRKMTEIGAGILMSTHLLEVAERLCDKIGILVGGRLVAEGSVAELRTMTKVAAHSAQDLSREKTLEDIFIELAAGEEYKEIIASLDAAETGGT